MSPSCFICSFAGRSGRAIRSRDDRWITAGHIEVTRPCRGSHPDRRDRSTGRTFHSCPRSRFGDTARQRRGTDDEAATLLPRWSSARCRPQLSSCSPAALRQPISPLRRPRFRRGRPRLSTPKRPGWLGNDPQRNGRDWPGRKPSGSPPNRRPRNRPQPNRPPGPRLNGSRWSKLPLTRPQRRRRFGPPRSRRPPKQACRIRVRGVRRARSRLRGRPHLGRGAVVERRPRAGAAGIRELPGAERHAVLRRRRPVGRSS